MSGITARQNGMRLLTALVPILIILGLAFIPALLHSGSMLVSLTYTVAEQNNANGAVILQGSFNQDLRAHETLWLYAENAEIELFVNGVCSDFNTRENTPSIFHSPGSGWFAFDSPGLHAGENVQISVRSYYGENEQAVSKLLSQFYIGDGSGLYQRLLGGLGFFGFVQILAFIAGVIYLGEGAIDMAAGMVSEGLRIALLGFYCASGGLWCVTDTLYPYFTLLVSPPWAAAILDMSGLLLFPIALAAMMRYYMRRKHTRRMMTAVLAVEIITSAVCMVVQFAGIADLIQLQTGIGAVALLSLVAAVFCILIELRRYRDGYLLLLLLTVLPVFLAIMIDGINVLWPFMPRRMMMRYSFGISVLLLISQLVSYAHAQRVKAEAINKMEGELAESRISIMLSQIQPHFLYNSLLGIKQLCDTEPKKASDALEHFSYYLRGNLDAIGNPGLIPFEKELEHLRDYLYLEKMRFPKKLNIVYEIDYQDFMLPPLTVQPIAENAVRYGIVKKKGGGTLTIRSERTPDAVIITVNDDGIGFDPAETKEDGRSHTGITNVRSRLQMLCGGSLAIESEKGVGTAAKIILPQKEGIPCESLR